jgi:hypothetical protein
VPAIYHCGRTYLADVRARLETLPRTWSSALQETLDELRERTSELRLKVEQGTRGKTKTTIDQGLLDEITTSLELIQSALASLHHVARVVSAAHAAANQ